MPTSPLSRRDFLAHATAASATLAICSPFATAQQTPATATITLGTGIGPTIPQDFIGLSYEAMQLEDPTFFAPENVGLVRQFRNLAPRGVLRLGGNTSEFSWWKAHPDTAVPVRPRGIVDDGEPPPDTMFAITPEAVRALKGFLDATGWTCIYGLNLGYGTVTTDVPEAEFVYNTLGNRLLSFQIGNEVDLFWRHLRDKATWNVDTYLQQWLTIARAVQKACPNAVFGMPDVAGDVTWLPKIAERWAAIPDKPRVVSLSHHYYVGGPPSNPEMNIAAILKPSARVKHDAELATTAATRMGVKVRMTEGNTCYQAGKGGVSDVYAAALWSATYLFELMQYGYSGVNLHGGSGHATAVSVGNRFRGEELMADHNLPHPKPFYTPIANVGTLAGSGTDGKLSPDYVLEPVGQGMKFAAAFAGCSVVPVTLSQPGDLNLVAYAARRPDGKVLLAILNKEANTLVEMTAPHFQTLQTLTGPALDARFAQVSSIVRETTSRRTSMGQTFVLPAHTGTLLVLS